MINDELVVHATIIENIIQATIQDSVVTATIVEEIVSSTILDGSQNTINYSGESHVIITQEDHGFVFGNVIRRDSNGSYVKALADSYENAEVLGIVSEVYSVDRFVIACSGLIIGFEDLVDGTVYFLSDETPGELSDAPPTTIDHINKPVLIATGEDRGIYMFMRGVLIKDV